MLTVRDAAYWLALATLGLLWYADRSLLADQLRQTQTELEIEREHVDELEVNNHVKANPQQLMPLTVPPRLGRR